jgi:hypothetical protein
MDIWRQVSFSSGMTLVDALNEEIGCSDDIIDFQKGECGVCDCVFVLQGLFTIFWGKVG